jgi:hypothetical protein
MSIRNLAVICAILALPVVLPSPGLAAGDLADNFVNLKVLFPVNGLEYEHVFPNGIGLSVAGSYLNAEVDDSGSDDDLTANTDKQYTAKYTTFGGGIKKYIGDHRMFYVAAYPNFLGIKLSQEEAGYTEEGSLSVFSFMGALGWRGVLGHFTLGGELGGGYLGLKDITLTGTDPDTRRPVEDTYDISVGEAGPTVQLYLGYAF